MMYDDDSGLIGRGYAQAYDEEKKRNKEGFLSRHKYIGKNSIERLANDIQKHIILNQTV